jgi:uncharacterized repeat protein (TIGR04076 family)
MVRIRITVLKTFDTKEIYGNNMPELPSGWSTTCPRLKAGDVFISEDGAFPQGFCSWAFADIQRDLTLVRFNCGFPGMPRGVIYSACTDGLRPVLFKIERLTE